MMDGVTVDDPLMGVGARGPLIVEFAGAHKKSKNNFSDKIDSIFVIYTKNWVC